MNQTRGKRNSTNPIVSNNLEACLCGILHKYASPSHPLDVTTIFAHLKQEIHQFSEDDINISMPTLRKALQNLWEFSNTSDGYQDFCTLIYGGRILRYYLDHASRKNHPIYVLDDGNNSRKNDHGIEKNPNLKTFYAFESQFQPQELFSLLNCAEVNPYLSEKEINELRSRLATAATPELVKEACNSYRSGTDQKLHIDADSEKLLANLGKIIELLHNEYQIEINYGKYVYHPQSSGFVLAPTRTYPNGLPKRQRLDPVAIFEANGFYYLVAHTDKSEAVDDLASYRIDRMIDIRPCLDYSHKPLPVPDDILKYRKKFSALEYKKSHPVMYGGDKEDIRMLVCEDSSFFLGNMLLDTFGNKGFRIRPVSEKEAEQYLSASTSSLAEKGENWFMVHLNHTIPGTVLWAKQHIEHVRILSPQKAVDALIEAVEQGLSHYRK